MNEPTLDAVLDRPRLKTLRHRILEAMRHEEWLTLRELQSVCGNSEAGISARLRELRNKFGYTINRRRRGVKSAGVWEYQIEKDTYSK